MVLGTFALDGDAVEGVLVGLHFDGAQVRGLAVAIDGAVAHVGDAGENAALVTGDDEQTALVCHATGNEGRVARREQGDIGIGQGLARLVEDGALVAVMRVESRGESRATLA